MRRLIAITTATVLVGGGFTAIAGAEAADDIALVQAELTAAAVSTRAAAPAGFSSAGTYFSAGGTQVTAVVDGLGHGRQVIQAEPEDQITYVSAGVGYWNHIAARTRKVYAAGLAYIGKPDAVYGFRPDAEATMLGAGLESGAESVDHLEKTRWTFLSANRTNPGNGQVVYTLTGYLDTPAQTTTLTATVTAGLVTDYREVTPITGDADQVFHRSWQYGAQKPVAVPTAAQTTTANDLARSRSAVTLKATVADHARETVKLAKTIARQAHRTTIRTKDVRTAGARVVAKYAEAGRYPADYLPTTATNLTHGIALHATDPYRHRVRIATVQAVNGRVVLSTEP